MTTSKWVLVCASFALFGCGVEVAEENDGTEAGTSEEPIFALTVVNVKEDGTLEVTNGWETLAQRRAVMLRRERTEIELRTGVKLPEQEPGSAADPETASIESAIQAPGACDDQSLWLFDQPNLAGNRLCVNGTGLVDLATVRRCLPCVLACPPVPFFPLPGICPNPTPGSWAEAARSAWAGAPPGRAATNIASPSTSGSGWFYGPFERCDQLRFGFSFFDTCASFDYPRLRGVAQNITSW